MTSPVPEFSLLARRGAMAIALMASPLAAEIAEPQAIFERYCFDCHGDGLSKGGVSIEDLLDAGAIEDNRHDWMSAWKIVRHELMPPADEDQPTAEERKALVRWIEDKQFQVDRENPDPGRVTIRRLNRMEFEYTLQDLFGTDFSVEETFSSDSSVASTRLRDMLPPDDTAFGFDNIGDFQTLSPALLEKYFSIAEFVVDQVVATEGPQIPVQRVNNRIGISKSAETKRTDHKVKFEVEHPGRYQVAVRFNLGGWSEFGGAFDFAMNFGDRELARDEIEVGGQKIYRYDGEVEMKQGENTLQLVTRATKEDAEGNLVHLQLRPTIEITGPLDGSIRNYPEPHRRIFFNGEPPDDPAERQDYAREILRRIADRAFRRPIDDRRLETLTEIAMRHEDFEKGVARALTAILSSPRFLFRAEAQPQPDDPDALHLLDEFALASRLSYLFWLSLPDAELSQMAAEGKLRENLHAQVERMLADPKSARFYEDFPGQWLRTRNVLMTPISRVDGKINSLRKSMKRETELLFQHIVEDDLDILELVNADYTFVDKPLADYYGLDHPGGGIKKIKLDPESKRGGILTQASFLIATSNPNRTSPVKRGLFVLENLLGIEPPPPPPDIPALEEPGFRQERTVTVREQLAAHRADKSCAACHAHFDPIGLTLENYDLIGLWRDTEAGQPIIPDETTTTGQHLAGVDDLREYFTDRRDRLYHCATEKLLTYALGRGLDPLDAPSVDRIAEDLLRDGGKFSTLLYGVIESPQFQTRRGDDGLARGNSRSLVPTPPPVEDRKGGRRMREILDRLAEDGELFDGDRVRISQRRGRRPAAVAGNGVVPGTPEEPEKAKESDE